MPTGNHRSSLSDRSAARLGIVGRTTFFRESLLRCLAHEADITAIDLGSGSSQTLEMARASLPDLVLIDLPPPEACLLAGLLAKAIPNARPIAVHRSSGPEDPRQLARAGYWAIVSNECSLPDLLREVRAAMRNTTPSAGSVASASGATPRPGPENDAERRDPLGGLSGREQQVALLLERQYSNKEIAVELGIGLGTVKNHVHNVLLKLRLHNRWEIQHLGRTKT